MTNETSQIDQIWQIEPLINPKNSDPSEISDPTIQYIFFRSTVR